MSTWHEIKDEDIDIDDNNHEINILVSGDDFGNNYITLTFEQIKEIWEKINE